MKQVNMLDLFGMKRMEDLFYKRFPALKGKVEVKTIKVNCQRCGRPYIFAWQYEQDGETKTYQFSKICSGCHNMGADKIIQQEVLKEHQQFVERKWYHIEPDDTCGFKNYQAINKVTEKARNTAVEYTKAVLTGTQVNLLLMGEPGTGKTHLARTIAKTAKEKGLKVAYIEAVELFNYIRQTFGHDRHKQILMDEFQNFDLVVIDDMGLETRKIGEVSWTVTEWRLLLEAREKKATVLTTNFTEEGLCEVIGKRAYSKLYENSRFIDLYQTEDFRKRLRV